MDSTYKGSEPGYGSQPTAGQTGRALSSDEVTPDLSADPNIPLRTEPLRSFSIKEQSENPEGRKPAVAEGEPRETPLWAQRISLIIFVLFCVELGLVLVVLPWTAFWTENNFVMAHPAVRAVLLNNFLRGAISGLGLVDVWLGIWEAAKYRENR